MQTRCSSCGGYGHTDEHGRIVGPCPTTIILSVPGSRADVAPSPEPVAPLGSAKRREQDIRMMKSPQHWPHTTLTMKRLHGGGRRLETAIWDGARLHIDDRRPRKLTAGGETTPTPEQIVDAGWTVD